MKREELEKEAEEWLDNERKYLIEDNEGNLINISKKVKEAYLASAEPREKRIAELEAEVKELEKENAELKTDYEVLSCSVGDFGELQDKLEEEQRKNNGLSDNLTNAKEIISEYINILKGDTKNWKKTQEKAERFLNIEK